MPALLLHNWNCPSGPFGSIAFFYRAASALWPLCLHRCPRWCACTVLVFCAYSVCCVCCFSLLALPAVAAAPGQFLGHFCWAALHYCLSCAYACFVPTPACACTLVCAPWTPADACLCTWVVLCFCLHLAVSLLGLVFLLATVPELLVFELLLLPKLAPVLLLPLLAPLLVPVLVVHLLTPSLVLGYIAPLLDLFWRLCYYCLCLHLCLHLC